MVLFASFSFARLFPLHVFGSVFLPTFPPISWHLEILFPSLTTPFSFIILLFDASSCAFYMKKPCKNGLFVGKDKLLRARAAIMLKFILKILLLGAHIVAWKCLFIVK